MEKKMTKDIKWSASKGELSGKRYEALSGGQSIGELVVNPELTKSGVIMGAFSVHSSEMFDLVAASAAMVAAGYTSQYDGMPMVVPITDQTGLITQPNN